MNVVFMDKRLQLIETDEAGSLNLPVAVIKAARKKLTMIRAAPDERTFRNWRSLHYEKLIGNRKGQYSIRLNDQWRLVFKMDKKSSPPTVIIINIEDYH